MKILRLDYVVTHYGLSKSPPPLGLFPLPIVTSPGPASLRVGFWGHFTASVEAHLCRQRVWRS